MSRHKVLSALKVLWLVLYLYVWVCTSICAPGCGDQRWTSGIFPSLHSTNCFKQGLLIEPEAHQLGYVGRSMSFQDAPRPTPGLQTQAAAPSSLTSATQNKRLLSNLACDYLASLHRRAVLPSIHILEAWWIVTVCVFLTSIRSPTVGQADWPLEKALILKADRVLLTSALVSIINNTV